MVSGFMTVWMTFQLVEQDFGRIKKKQDRQQQNELELTSQK